MADNPILFLFNLIGSLVCHQLPDRTLCVGGYFLPVCARDTGAYLGLLLGYYILPFGRKRLSGPPNLMITLIMLAPMIVDGGTQWIGLRSSTNEVRLITGFLFGTGLAPLLIYSLSLLPSNRRMPLLANYLPETVDLGSKDRWLSNRSLIMGMPISVAFFFVVSSLAGSSNTMFYWVISPLIVASIVWHIFLLPVTLLILYVFRTRV